MIKIRKPYIKIKEEKVRLCSVVNYDGNDNEIWYEVDKEYGEFLCHERADAFLLAFLPYAMAFKHDIEIEGAVSEKLLYQLNNYYIPALSKFSNIINLLILLRRQTQLIIAIKLLRLRRVFLRVWIRSIAY